MNGYSRYLYPSKWWKRLLNLDLANVSFCCIIDTCIECSIISKRMGSGVRSFSSNPGSAIYNVTLVEFLHLWRRGNNGIHRLVWDLGGVICKMLNTLSGTWLAFNTYWVLIDRYRPQGLEQLRHPQILPVLLNPLGYCESRNIVSVKLPCQQYSTIKM